MPSNLFNNFVVLAYSCQLPSRQKYSCTANSACSMKMRLSFNSTWHFSHFFRKHAKASAAAYRESRGQLRRWRRTFVPKGVGTHMSTPGAETSPLRFL